MRILLDTHTLIWYADSPERLPKTVRDEITDGHNEVFISVASAWEMTIKVSIGRLSLASPPYQLVADQLVANHFELLQIGLADLQVLQGLPLHHRDPFDRLLIAQAISAQLKFASVDTALDTYGVDRIWSS